MSEMNWVGGQRLQDVRFFTQVGICCLELLPKKEILAERALSLTLLRQRERVAILAGP